MGSREVDVVFIVLRANGGGGSAPERFDAEWRIDVLVGQNCAAIFDEFHAVDTVDEGEEQSAPSETPRNNTADPFSANAVPASPNKRSCISRSGHILASQNLIHDLPHLIFSHHHAA